MIVNHPGQLHGAICQIQIPKYGKPNEGKYAVTVLDRSIFAPFNAMETMSELVYTDKYALSFRSTHPSDFLYELGHMELLTEGEAED